MIFYWVFLIFALAMLVVDIWVTYQNTKELRLHRIENRVRAGYENTVDGDPLGITQPTDTKGML